jgi:hypothetical protein
MLTRCEAKPEHVLDRIDPTVSSFQLQLEFASLAHSEIRRPGMKKVISGKLPL